MQAVYIVQVQLSSCIQNPKSTMTSAIIFFFFRFLQYTIRCLFLQVSVNTTIRRKQLPSLQIEEIYCSSLDLAQLQQRFFKIYCYHFIISYFPLALVWSLIALAILTGIICNMSILLLHLQFKVILIRTLKLCQ